MSSILALVMTAVGAFVKFIVPPSREMLEERYLNDAKDLYDLEYRIREIDRGNFSSSRLSETAHY